MSWPLDTGKADVRCQVVVAALLLAILMMGFEEALRKQGSARGRDR